MTSSQWLTLSDLGRRFGLSAKHCGHALDHQGWRDCNGHPTQAAITAGAAQRHNTHHHSPSNRWNADICATVISSHGHHPIHLQQVGILCLKCKKASSEVCWKTAKMARGGSLGGLIWVKKRLKNRSCRIVRTPSKIIRWVGDL